MKNKIISILRKATLMALLAAFSGPASGIYSTAAKAGEHCKVTSVQGWGLTEELATLQAQQLLLFSTGNWIVQNDKFSKPENKCTLSLLGWTCTTTAKVCKK